MNSKHSNFGLLANMNVGFWGAQLGNGLQTANASAIFESLGADATQLPLLWLGAPLTGLIVQPLVGGLSDRTWTRWGRRQPYFLGGALLGTVMLVGLPLSNTLWQAALLYWGLQLALNICIAPTRPFVGDLLPPQWHTLGYSIQGVCVGLGAVCAAALPWLLEQAIPSHSISESGVPMAITVAYWVGATLLISCTVWTFQTVDEPLPEKTDSSATTTVGNGMGSIFSGILRAVPQMPLVMRQLAGVQILTWSGIYCIFLYLPTAIAHDILNATDSQSTAYAHAVEWAGVCIAFYNIVCLGVSFVLPTLSQWWGRVTTHAFCLLCGTLGLISLLGMHHRYPILLAMIGIGIAWASILSIPYSLLIDELSADNRGVYMGLFNVFVTLPQIVLSLGFGWLMKTWLHGDRLATLVIGGCFLGLAALLMLRVSEPTSQEQRETQTLTDLLMANPQE
jgi:maltose/moltooligosaccharide transporter